MVKRKSNAKPEAKQDALKATVVCRIKDEGKRLAADPSAEAIEAYRRTLGLLLLEAAIKDAA